MDVQVFVDDFVRGDLPSVCAVTGEPTKHRKRLRASVDASPLWLVLVFFGPPGWAVIFLAAVLLDHRKIDGLIPVAPDSVLRYQRNTMISILLLGAGVALVLIALFSLGDVLPFGGTIWVGLAVVGGFLVRTLFMAGRFPKAHPDGSRRWITIKGVHPNFAAAVAERELTDDFARRDRRSIEN